MSPSHGARERMERKAVDASTSGTIPLLGMAALTFIVAAIMRLIL